MFARALERFNSWPVYLQVLGGLAICFGIGMVAGLGYGVITLGIEALVAGTLADQK